MTYVLAIHFQKHFSDSYKPRMLVFQLLAWLDFNIYQQEKIHAQLS